MKIVSEKNILTVEQVPPGHVFKYGDGTFMRTDGPCDHRTVSVVNLESGHCTSMLASSAVIHLLNATLYAEG